MGLRWVGLGLMGFGLALACSDDPASPGPGAPQGGEGGEQAGAPTKAGTGGMTQGGAQTGNGGSSAESNDGGVAGAPLTPAQACTACGTTECAEKLAGAATSLEGKMWLGCVSACTTGECTTDCDTKFPGVARTYAGVYDCLCTSCTDDCTDIGVCEKTKCTDQHPLALLSTAPATLAETGLYELLEDGSAGGAGGAAGAGGAPGVVLAMPIKVAGYVDTFEVKYPLWSDGATKQRYIYIPKCETIDTSDMDHWKFPVGTRIWKQFSVDGHKVETRLMSHFGPGEADWLFAAYQWNPNELDDPTAAIYVDPAEVPDGVINANGTGHDIPSIGMCNNCHGKLSEKVLGFSAFQLSHAAVGQDLAIKDISGLGWLTKPSLEGFNVPGDAVQQAALGYLHGNCGSCHNQSAGIGGATPLVLRLLTSQTAYADTDAVKSSVGVAMTKVSVAPTRIAPMDPDNSGVLKRMIAMNNGDQMPPIAAGVRHVPDTNGGIKDVTAWINSIPKP